MRNKARWLFVLGLLTACGLDEISKSPPLKPSIIASKSLKTIPSSPTLPVEISPRVTHTPAVVDGPTASPTPPSVFVTSPPSEWIAPIVQPTPRPTVAKTTDPFSEYRHLDSFNNNTFCYPRDSAPIQARLRYPLDVAVSKDGNHVYVLNKRCGAPIYFSKIPESIGRDCEQSRLGSDPLINRAYIYDITPNREISTVKIKGVEPLSCQIGEDIEMDRQGNLYLNAPGDNRLYRIPPDKNKVELLGEYKETATDGDYSFICDPNPELDQCYSYAIQQTSFMAGPSDIQVQDSHLYFLLKNPFINNQGGQLREWKGMNDSITWISKGWYFYSYLVQNHQNVFFADVHGIGKADFPSQSETHFSHCLLNDTCLFTGGIQIRNETRRFEGLPGFIDGKSDQARFNRVRALRTDSSGQLYVADLLNHAIRKVAPDGTVTTLAGSGQPGFANGLGRNAQFNYPTAIDIDDAGNLYVADTANHAIRKITPDGLVTTFYAETKPN